MTTERKTTNEYLGQITGVKLVHELMVDIMGGLIPGVLFLFSILMCIVFPIFCYTGIPHFPNENGGSDGWFWVVVFLTFLILSYVIGHIFYRSDIKEPDKADLNRQQNKFFKKQLQPSLMNIVAEGKREDSNKPEDNKKDENNIQNKVVEHIIHLLISEIEPLRESMESKGAKNSESDVYNENFLNNCNVAIKGLKELLKNSKENDGKYRDSLLSVLFPEIKKERPDKSRQPLEQMDHYTIIIDSYKKKIRPILHKVIAQRLDELLLDLTVYYSILHFQNEAGCATEDRCDFPYISYYKYLLKRKETELLKYVNWCTNDSRTKNKINKYKIKLQMFASNAYSILNKNESHIRMAASSWHVAEAMKWIVWIMMFITAIPIVARIFLYINDKAIVGLIDEWLVDILTHVTLKTGMLMLCISFVFPFCVCILLRYIQNRVTMFIHYQRLREIYHTLFIYYQWESNLNASQERESRLQKTATKDRQTRLSKPNCNDIK